LKLTFILPKVRDLRERRTLLVAVCALAVAASCGKPDPSLMADGEGPFIAFGSDFAGFEGWTSHTIDDATPSGATHTSGVRTVYINRRPASGATAFPQGTLIVKVTQADQKVFARAKRGGDYNASGATGWEWFELQPGSGSAVTITWRGVGPPAGEQYGGDPNGGCNSCHRLGAANDFVLSPWLALATSGDGGTAADGVADAALGGETGGP
jgi:hypothetical protein